MLIQWILQCSPLYHVHKTTPPGNRHAHRVATASFLPSTDSGLDITQIDRWTLFFRLTSSRLSPKSFLCFFLLLFALLFLQFLWLMIVRGEPSPKLQLPGARIMGSSGYQARFQRWDWFSDTYGFSTGYWHGDLSVRPSWWLPDIENDTTVLVSERPISVRSIG